MNFFCEICTFADQCDGSDFSPVCYAKLAADNAHPLSSSDTKQTPNIDDFDDYDYEKFAPVHKKLQTALETQNKPADAHNDFDLDDDIYDDGNDLWDFDDDDLVKEDITDIDSFLFEFIFEACEYFRELGYVCNPDEIYKIVNEMQGEKINLKLLISGMIVKTRKQKLAFDDEFRYFVKLYYHHKEQTDGEKHLHDINKNNLKQKLDSYEQKRQKLLDMMNQEPKEVKKAKETEKKQESIKNLKQCLNGCPMLTDFVKLVKASEPVGKERLMSEVKKAMAASTAYKNSKELMQAVKERGKQLEAIKKNDINSQLKNIQKNIDKTQENLKKEDERFAARMSEILKEKPMQHREEFDKSTAHNAVNSKYEGDVLFNTKFSKMTDRQKHQIYDYIRDNARKFRTRMTRKILAANAKKVDIKTTVKKSCQTGGIPLKLVYQRPERQKTNLVMILDVSGSCKDAAEMMLVFMHAMKEVFPGGCKTYAFTNRLYDISKFFETNNADESVKAVLNAIPRAGAYSNYEIPFKTMYKEHMSDITEDTYVYIIGDARNNKNNSGAEYIKAVARKAKKAFWLNTEDRELWNHGDSIIDKYAPYMTKVVQTETPAELLSFLEN